MTVIKIGNFVVVKGGRVGIASHINTVGQIEVQLGTDGPFEFYKVRDVRLATAAEVKKAELEGVGGTVAEEESTGIAPNTEKGRKRSSD